MKHYVELLTTSWSNYFSVVKHLGWKIQSFWSKYDLNTAHFGEKRPYTAFLRKYGPLYKLWVWAQSLGRHAPLSIGPPAGARQTCLNDTRGLKSIRSVLRGGPKILL